MTKNESTIIFGFPGVGKSYACQHAEELGLTLVDSDSSDFHWKKDENGDFLFNEEDEKILNPEWPDNYIEHIELIGRKDELHPEYIMVATRPEIVDAIIDKKFDNNIIICPAKSMKDEFILRYKNRGSEDRFIKKIADHFDEYIDNMAKRAFEAEDVNVFFVEIREGGRIQNVYDFLKSTPKIAMTDII